MYFYFLISVDLSCSVVLAHNSLLMQYYSLQFRTVTHISLDKLGLGRLRRETITSIPENWNNKCFRAAIKISSEANRQTCSLSIKFPSNVLQG